MNPGGTIFGLPVTRQESGKLATECEAITESSAQQRLAYFSTGANASNST